MAEATKLCAEMRQIRDEAKAEQEASKAEAAALKAELAAEKSRAKAEADVLRRRLDEAEKEKEDLRREKERKDKKERREKERKRKEREEEEEEEEDVEEVAIKPSSRRFKEWKSTGEETKFEDVDSMVFNFKDRVLPPVMDNIAKACILPVFREVTWINQSMNVSASFFVHFDSGPSSWSLPSPFVIYIFRLSDSNSF